MHPVPYHPAKGQIQVIFGPMFSGKTTELIRRCKRYQLANYHCIVVKYANDNRYDDEQIATHDNQKLPAISISQELMPKIDMLSEYEVIGIDEGQFFSDVVETAERLANKGKTVIVAALDGDFRRVGFGDILHLVPKAESVIKLTAVCMMCFKNASYTKRISADTELEVIGGSDKYVAACRDCHSKDINEQMKKDEASQTPTKNSVLSEINGNIKQHLAFNEELSYHELPVSPRKMV